MKFPKPNVKNLWYFVGSFWFAIFLISMTALFVVAGTWIEGCTGSHWCAAYYTYSSPIFALLLWGYFVNILISALRRWPFRKTHIPFLLTHLGLLMLISGVLAKIYFGTQGSMGLVEGKGNDEVFIIPSEALYLETKEQKIIHPLQNAGVIGKLSYYIKERTPHSQLEWTSWVNDGYLTLRGVPPLAFNRDPLPIIDQAPWYVAATTMPLQDILAKHAIVKIENSLTQNSIAEIPLSEFLKFGFEHGHYQFSSSLKDKLLSVNIYNQSNGNREKIEFSLDGLNPTPYQKKEEILLPSLYTISLKSLPLVIYYSTDQKNPSIALINSSAEILELPEQEASLFAYAHGFGGYSTVVESSWPADPRYKEQRWEEVRQALQASLDQPGSALAPPLQLLQTSGTDVATALIHVLEAWLNTGTWLSDRLPYADALDWAKVNPQVYLRWKQQASLYQLLQMTAGKGEDVLGHLSKIIKVERTDKKELINSVLLNAEAFANVIPSLNPSKSLILSAALRDQGIHPEFFVEEFPVASSANSLKLESKLHPIVSELDPSTKWEDNRPGILVKVKEGLLQEEVRLQFDKYGSQLKIPVLQGQYLVRYQSEVQKIPYRLRLREARQINYPGTNQPFSFEADIVITRDGWEDEATISMNNVYETWDGYRFYLANIQSGKREDLQHIQIVVNRDPVKYWLTLPGFAVLIVGAFWLLLRTRKT